MVFVTFLGVFLLLFVAFCVLVGIASRSLSWYLSRVLQQRYDIRLKIGQFGFLTINEVHLQFKDGTTLEVENVWITSCLFSAKYSSYLVMCLGDVRLQAHFDKLLKNKPSKRVPPDKAPGVQKLQLPRNIMTFLKRMSVHVHNVSIMQLGAPSQGCLLHATFQEVALHILARDHEYSVGLHLISAALRIFKHPQDTSTNDSCMAHFCVSVQGNTTVCAEDLRIVHSATVDIHQPEIMLYEDKLLEVLSSREVAHRYYEPELLVSGKLEGEACLGETSIEETPLEGDSSEENALPSDKLRSFISKLPESVRVRMESSSIKILKDNWQRGLFLEVHSLSAELLRDASEDYFATCLLALSSLALTSDQFQVVSLKSAETKCRLHHEQVDIGIRLASLHMSYSEDELHQWVRLLPPHRKVAHGRRSKR